MPNSNNSNGNGGKKQPSNDPELKKVTTVLSYLDKKKDDKHSQNSENQDKRKESVVPQQLAQVPVVKTVVKKGTPYLSWWKAEFESIELIRNAYKEVIGQDVFKHGLKDEIAKQVLRSKTVQDAIHEYMTSHNKSKTKAMMKAEKVLSKLQSDFQERMLRTFALIVSHVLQRLYNGIHLSQKELLRVREIALKAQQEKIPLILLPTHKSHVDYLVISYVFFLCNLSLPFIVAGDNLMLPLVGQILRNSGAFFIKRKFDSNKVYRAIFNEYIQTIISKGYNFEFFIEGGRSRTGKLLRPKMGVLSLIVEAHLNGNLKDAYLVPISIGYDKVVETEQYVKELLGGTKEKESVGALLKSAQLLKLNFGRVDLRIAQPFSLKEYIAEQTSQRAMTPGAKKIDPRLITQVLAYSILYRINKVSVTLPTAIVVSVLLTHKGRGISRTELITKFEWLRDQIKARGGKVATPDTPIENTGQLIDTALNVLGSLVEKQKNVLQPIFTPAKRFELSYYRNQILHLFVNEGLVACCVYSHVRLRTTSAVVKEVLLKDVAFLSQLLKLEIIYLPSPDIRSTFEQTIKEMIERGSLILDSENNIRIAPNGIPQFDFLCALFWPFIESYWLLCCSLYALYPSAIMEEKVFLQRVQNLGFTFYHQGELAFYESINKETMSNAMILFTGMGVVEKQSINESGTGVLKLTKDYMTGDKLVNLIEDIGRMRREGRYAQNQAKFNDYMKGIVKMVAKL